MINIFMRLQVLASFLGSRNEWRGAANANLLHARRLQEDDPTSNSIASALSESLFYLKNTYLSNYRLSSLSCERGIVDKFKCIWIGMRRSDMPLEIQDGTVYRSSATQHLNSCVDTLTVELEYSILKGVIIFQI